MISRKFNKLRFVLIKNIHTFICLQNFLLSVTKLILKISKFMLKYDFPISLFVFLNIKLR